MKLDAAAHLYAEAFNLLGGTPLLEAAKFYQKHHQLRGEVRTVQEVVDELVADSARRKLSERRVRELRNTGNRIGKAIQLPITQLTSDLARKWLESNSVDPRTYNNRLETMQRIVSFAKTRGYLPKDFEITVERIKVVDCDPEIWTPDEIQGLLDNAPAETVPMIAIGAFAGLRTAELRELRWEDIMEGFITIRAQKAKTGKRRFEVPPKRWTGEEQNLLGN